MLCPSKANHAVNNVINNIFLAIIPSLLGIASEHIKDIVIMYIAHTKKEASLILMSLALVSCPLTSEVKMKRRKELNAIVDRKIITSGDD